MERLFLVIDGVPFQLRQQSITYEPNQVTISDKASSIQLRHSPNEQPIALEMENCCSIIIRQLTKALRIRLVIAQHLRARQGAKLNKILVISTVIALVQQVYLRCWPPQVEIQTS